MENKRLDWSVALIAAELGRSSYMAAHGLVKLVIEIVTAVKAEGKGESDNEKM